MEHASETQIKRSSKTPWVILLLLLLVATALRLYKLNAGLWVDEILTFLRYARLPYGEIVTQFESENQHFIYSLLAHTSFLLFGESGWALRLPAVLFGVGSIAALYLFGREITREREVLLSAALLTFSYHHVWFSQNARGYSGLLFWTLLSSWLLLVGARRNSTLIWVCYGLTAALGVYTHLTMVFVILGQLVSHFYTTWIKSQSGKPAFWRGLLWGFGTTAILTLLLHAPVLSQMRGVIGGSQVSVVEEWKSPLWTLLEFLRGIQIGFSSVIVVGLALVWFGVGMYSYLRNRAEVVLLMVIPSLVGAGVTMAIGHHLWPRFFFFTFGFGALIVVRGAMVLARWFVRILKFPEARADQLGTLVCLGIILISAMSVTLAYGPKQDYESALNFINTSLEPGDEVVSINIAGFVYDEFYKTGWKTVNSLDELNQIRDRSGRTWMVYTFEPVLESVYPDIYAAIQTDFQLIKEFPGTVNAGTVYVYLADRSKMGSDDLPIYTQARFQKARQADDLSGLVKSPDG